MMQNCSLQSVKLGAPPHPNGDLSEGAHRLLVDAANDEGLSAYPPRLIQREGGVVLQLDDACQLLHSLQYSGCDIICQLFKGLVQEVHYCCQLPVMYERVTLICTGQLQCHHSSDHHACSSTHYAVQQLNEHACPNQQLTTANLLQVCTQARQCFMPTSDVFHRQPLPT